MTSEVVDIFKNKKEDGSIKPLTTEELKEFKKILELSIDNFHNNSVFEKINLYSEVVNLCFILMDIVHPELKEE